MKLSAYNLAESTPFSDIPLGIHWYERGFQKELFDKQYAVGRIYPCFGEYIAESYWGNPEQSMQTFATEEEAKAYLVAIYRLLN